MRAAPTTSELPTSQARPSLCAAPGSASERHGPLIAVLKQSLWREQERIRRAEAEIFTINQELLELGVELPLNE